MSFETKNYVAITPPQYTKVEAKVQGGLAMASNRLETIVCGLVFNFGNYEAGSRVILDGQSGLMPWAKKIYNHDGQSFVLAPTSEIIAYEV